METRTVLKETWLSRKPRRGALDLTLGLVGLLVLATFAYLNGAEGWERALAASGAAVFGRHEYWRAWTALFAHADFVHLGSNLLLFVPFSYFLSGYYPRWFYPLLAFAEGGLVNFAVLKTMPPEASLVGVSGVIYWMGAAWLTLYLLIEKRDPPRVRIGKVVIVTAALFLPETVRPEVSYAAHYLGFVAGVVSAAVLYRIRRHVFLSAERRVTELLEEIPEEIWRGEEESP